MGVDREQLARRAVESYLQQLLNHGFFHADPHPGGFGFMLHAGSAGCMWVQLAACGCVGGQVDE